MVVFHAVYVCFVIVLVVPEFIYVSPQELAHCALCVAPVATLCVARCAVFSGQVARYSVVDEPVATRGQWPVLAFSENMFRLRLRSRFTTRSVRQKILRLFSCVLRSGSSGTRFRSVLDCCSLCVAQW